MAADISSWCGRGARAARRAPSDDRRTPCAAAPASPDSPSGRTPGRGLHPLEPHTPPPAHDANTVFISSAAKSRAAYTPPPCSCKHRFQFLRRQVTMPLLEHRQRHLASLQKCPSRDLHPLAPRTLPPARGVCMFPGRESLRPSPQHMHFEDESLLTFPFCPVREYIARRLHSI